MSLGDQEYFRIAAEIEKDLNIDMNLRDVFSNDLNNYFSFNFLEKEEDSDFAIVEFNFEIEEGSAKIVLENPRDYCDIKFNNLLDEDLYYHMFINKELALHFFNRETVLSSDICDNMFSYEDEYLNE